MGAPSKGGLIRPRPRIKEEVDRREEAKKKKPAKQAPAKQTPGADPFGGLGKTPEPPRPKITAKGVIAKAGLGSSGIVRSMLPEHGADYGLDRDATSSMYKLAPELLGPSRQASVYADPDSIAAQQRAMDELFGIYGQGGATAQDRAREGQARANSDQYIRSQREAHQQDLGERGMYGSGAEIGMLLGDRQNAATTMSQSDLDTQAMHEQRAMDALMKGGDLAGVMRGSSFEEGSSRAKAADYIDEMNNKIVNIADESNKSFIRDQRDALFREQAASHERSLDRNVGVASGIVKSDAEETHYGNDKGEAAAEKDVDAFNDAGERVEAAVARRPNAMDKFMENTAYNDAYYGSKERAAKGIGQYARGGGKMADSIIGASAGGSSAGATDFSGVANYAPTGKDDEEED